jgi:hypothetical protein
VLTQDLGTFHEGLHHNVVGQSCFCWSHLMHSSSVFASRLVGTTLASSTPLSTPHVCFSGCLRMHHCCDSANASKGPISIGLQRLPHAELGRWHGHGIASALLLVASTPGVLQLSDACRCIHSWDAAIVSNACLLHSMLCGGSIAPTVALSPPTVAISYTRLRSAGPASTTD